jgi:hypothetical protein
VVECTCLENRRARKGSVGSNPTSSAKLKRPALSELASLIFKLLFQPDEFHRNNNRYLAECELGRGRQSFPIWT